METKKLFKYVGRAVIVLLLFVMVGTVLGQEPDPGNEGIIATALPEEPSDEVEGEPVPVDEAVEEPGLASEEFILAQPPYTMNYQGYLTDGSGNPLNGTYNLRFRLYDAGTGGDVEWGPENHYNTPVVNGIFQVALGSIVPLSPNDFDEALFLRVQVDGTDVYPRQPLRSVPYAFGLVPGAEVEGDPSNTNYGLRVDNTGTDVDDRGIYARGYEYGLVAVQDGPGDVGIKAYQFVEAEGYKSTSDSFLWVPATTAVPGSQTNFGSDIEMDYRPNGSVIVRKIAGSGSENIFIPIAIPVQLYGQHVDVEYIRVYYKCSNVNSYINSTYLNKQTGADSQQVLISNSTNRTSTSNAYYAIAPSPTALSTSAGPLNLNLYFHFANNTDTIRIGGVRLQLGHVD